MSLEEFARLVGMDPRQVQREADRGELPGRKVGGKWRFNRVQVHEWVERRMLTLDEERLQALDRGIGRSTDAGDSPVTDLMGVESIDLDLRAATKASVLRELVNLAERTGLLYEGPALHQALREREALGSTALPHGLAIPHPEKPMPYTTAEPLVCLARVPNPVAFNAPDGALTQLFFLICSHESNAHLHVLARLMRMLDDGMIDTLRAIEDPAEALQVMIAREQQVAKTVS
jgi:PTS system nitrogen regulatory IIA component